MPSIHWFRRDLRISDNTALHHAAKDSDSVIPLYIVSDWSGSHPWTGPTRQAFLCEALASLSKNLEAIGGRLIFRQGPQLQVLEDFLRETKADALYLNQDPDPFGKATEKKVATLCKKLGVAYHSYHDHTLHAPDEVLKNDGDPYRVFTPYFKTWFSLEKPAALPKPSNLNSTPDLKSDPAPTLATWNLKNPPANLPPAGEKAARHRLATALENTLPAYAETRNLPALPHGTSNLSPDLRHGTISIRTIYQKVREAQAEASPKSRDNFTIFLKELAWREFYMAILHHFPEVLQHEFNPDYCGLPWDEPGDQFEAWKNGETGFPFVDAGMRQLLQTGVMHNRLRMVTAMFLTKDLHLDWRLGEAHFMQHLIDGEIASNNGGWQWSAGTGADAAPYFRIQNPWTQGKRFDPDGIFTKKFLPELKEIQAKALHSPPENGPLVKDYPAPIVNHARERQRTLDLFKKHRENQQ